MMQLSRRKLFSLLAIVTLMLLPQAGLTQIGLGNDTSVFGRTIYVHATGSPAENADALTAALGSTLVTSRTDPASEPVVIQLGPGVFDVGDGFIDMPDHVSLQGSGVDVTTITSSEVGLPISFNGTTNQVSHLTVAGGHSAIGAYNGAKISIHDAKTKAPSGVSIGNATFAEITHSTLLSTGDDALSLGGGATVTIDYSVIDGPDSYGDGLYYTSGSLESLTVRYTFIGINGISDPGSGTLVCAYISGTGGEISGGCPPPPAPAIGTVRTPAHTKGHQ